MCERLNAYFTGYHFDFRLGTRKTKTGCHLKNWWNGGEELLLRRSSSSVLVLFLTVFWCCFFEQRTYALLVSTCVVHIDFQIKIFKISILLVLLLRSSLCFCYGHSIPKNWCRKSRINYRLFFRLLTKIVFEIDRKQNLRQTRNMTGTYWWDDSIQQILKYETMIFKSWFDSSCVVVFVFIRWVNG